MTDSNSTQISGLSANSQTTAFSIEPLIPSLSISAIGQRELLDPLSATVIQANESSIFQALAQGVSGLKVEDLSNVFSQTKLSTPVVDFGVVKTAQSIDTLIGVVANSPLVNELCRGIHHRDTLAPKLTVGLAHDTGISNSDKSTNNSSIQGTVKDDSRIGRLQAQLDGGRTYNISSELGRNGKFTLSKADVQRINGGKQLADGQHTIKIIAADVFGNTSTSNLNFTLDTTAPIKATLTLDKASDSGTIGDNRTNNDLVTLTGKSEANSQVKISQAGSTTAIGTVTTDVNGNYQLTGVHLANGINSFTIQASDLAGNTSTSTQDIRLIAKDDAVITWNQILLNAIATGKTAPPVASRAMAMVETAVFDAVNNIVHKYQNYAITEAAPVAANCQDRAIEAEAAAVEAAYTVLSSLFTSQKATFDAARTTSLATIADGQAKIDGLSFGKTIADKAIAARANDGSTIKVAYTSGTNPGDWQPTAVITNPDGTTSPAPAVLPQWGNVKTFGIIQSDILANRPAPPPALTSAQYATELNQVKDLGAANSTTRTADQTEIAKFWADGGGTFTPPGHWNQIAQDVARDKFNSLIDNARLFAALDVAQADAAICCWDTKYAYSQWRPMTAIRNADKDGNDGTTADSSWTSLLTTPNFPTYTSGHSTFSGAAATVLTSFYGDNYAFSTTSPGLAGVSRSFTSFNQAAEEAGMSRIYGGIHFMSDNLTGLAAGKTLATYITKNLFVAA
jgi:PAP2 superfamily/Bacterial Ig-like domain